MQWLIPHHLKALLLTFGCDAVFPYMAYEALRVLASEGKFLVSDAQGAEVEILEVLFWELEVVSDPAHVLGYLFLFKQPSVW